jgi:hypothetical protein
MLSCKPCAEKEENAMRHRWLLTRVLILVLAAALPAGAWTGSPTGTTFTVNYTEPTATTTGAPLGLTKTTIYYTYQVGTGPVSPEGAIAVPASAPVGGGVITRAITAPILSGQTGTVTVRITASNATGESARTAAVVTTANRTGEVPPPPPPGPPTAPTGLTVTCGTANCTLQWQPVSGATGYRVYRASLAPPWILEQTVPAPPATVVFRVDLTHYTVAAVNAAGETLAGSAPGTSAVTGVWAAR